MSNLPTSNMFWWSNIPSFVSSGTPNPCSKWNYFAILKPQMSCLFLTDAGKLPVCLFPVFQTEEAIKL